MDTPRCTVVPVLPISHLEIGPGYDERFRLVIWQVEEPMHPVTAQLQRMVNVLRDEAGDVSERTPEQTLLSPWANWLLLSLVRHVERQQWVGGIVETQLGVDMREMSEAGALAHPPVPQVGLVPKLSAWEYVLHGRGCCLTHRITGESIDVDFYDGSPDWIDDYFYLAYLHSLKKPEFIEQRLIALHPTLETIKLAFDELLVAGVLEKHPESKVVKPLDELQALGEDINQLNLLLKSPDRRGSVAQLLGDWMLASHSDPSHAELAEQAARCRKRRSRLLEQLFDSGKSERLALMALCDLSPERSVLLERALSKPPSGTTSAALSVVFSRPQEDWTSLVYDLLCRTDPSGEIPHPYTWTRCAEYLLQRHSHFEQIRNKIYLVGRRCLGDAAVLALEYFPGLAVDLFRRALRSDVPCDRNTAAAALAIVDQPWSHLMLLQVLEESTDQEATAECRAALLAMSHRELHAVVDQWERDHPHEPKTGPFISMSEMSLQTRETWMQQEMETLHERVIRLRPVVPPDETT
ncbi:MAG: hypothetical protein KDA90_21305 [Planctomycetaceae bacterium]|nr:hypothetical protein [Planctomycetaceae bacterium]